MRNSENATGKHPAVLIDVPSRCAVSVTVTGRVIPFSVSVAAAIRVITASEASSAFSETGLVKVTVAYGWAVTSRLARSCGWRVFRPP
jgi:hypothetical protein